MRTGCGVVQTGLELKSAWVLGLKAWARNPGKKLCPFIRVCSRRLGRCGLFFTNLWLGFYTRSDTVNVSWHDEKKATRVPAHMDTCVCKHSCTHGHRCVHVYMSQRKVCATNGDCCSSTCSPPVLMEVTVTLWQTPYSRAKRCAKLRAC